MKKQNNTISGHFRKASFFLSITIALIGLVVLAGWLWDIPVLKSISPSWVSMKVNTSVCFLLSGITLILANSEKHKNISLFPKIFSVIILLISVTTLLQYIFNFNAGIDELFFRDDVLAVGTSHPGRMSPPTALCFILFGFSILLIEIKLFNRYLFQIFSLVAGSIAFISCMGYIFEADKLRGITGYTIMAFHTSVCLLLLNIALLFSQPDKGFMQFISGKSIGARFFRYLFPFAIFSIIMFGWLHYKGEELGLFDSHYSIVFLIFTLCMAVSFSIWYSSIINSKTEEALLESEEKYRNLFQNSAAGMYRTKIDGSGFMEVNDKFLEIIGYSREEIFSKAGKIHWKDPADRDKMIKMLQSNKGVLNNYEAQVLHKNGKVIDVLASIKLQNDRGYLEGTMVDITERKKAIEDFQSVITTTPDGFWIIDTSTGKFLEVNDAYCKMSGYSKKELLSMQVNDVEANEKPEDTIKHIQYVLENGHDRFETQHRTKSGKLIDLEVSVTYTGPEKGKFYIFLQDISERLNSEKEIRNNEKRFKELLNSLPQLIWTCRADGPCDFLSEQWVNYTGIPEEKQLGYGWLEQLHANDRDRTVAEWMEKVKTGKSFDIEFRIRRHDGSHRWFKTKAIPLKDAGGTIVKWFGSNTDFDDFKKAQERLKSLVSKLENSNRELEQFAHVASHDLQEPLRMISSFTQLIEKRFNDKLDQDGRDYIKYAVDGANRLQKLINDLLDFSRITTKGKSFVQVDTSVLLGNVVSNLHQLINDNSALITNDDLPVVFADETQLFRVFQNLIGNALKFKKKTEFPKVHVSCFKKDNVFVFSVKDNGIGIEPQYQERIFTIFQRLHSVKDYPGTGIGLSICKRIVEGHGGFIWLESIENEGTTFYFSILDKQGDFN